MRLAVFAVLLAACTTQQLPTSELGEQAGITDGGDHLDILVDFADVNNVSTDAGTLTATFRGAKHQIPYDAAAYRGAIALVTPLVADEPVELALDRDGETVVSTVTSPQPLVLDPVPASVSRSSDLAVTFSPGSEDETSWGFSGSCAFGGGPVATGADNVVIQPNEIRVSAGGTCDVLLEIMRTRHGTPATQFRDGYVDFVTTSDATFSSTP